MDLSAVARQRVSRRGEESASGRTRTTDDDDDEDDDLDQEEAKALVRDFIKHALDGVRHGARAQYYELLEALTGLEKPDVSQDKLLMLTVLVECVSSLDERLHESLLQRVLGTSLWRCGPEVGRLVLEFCVNLVSTHTGSLLQACLDVLVSSFAPPPGYDLDALASDGRGDGGWGAGAPSATRVGLGLGAASPDASDPNPAPPSPAAVSAAIVGAVETILNLVPLAASVLRPVLLSRLPHKSTPGATQAWYLRSAFKLVETSAGAPLRDALLRGVVAHLLEVDVEIKWEDIRQPGDESSDDEDVEDDMDGDGLDGKDGGAGIFELEDIERTIEEQLVRQAAAWERGAGAHLHGGHHAHGNGRGGHSPSHHGHDAAVDEMADALDSMMEVTVAHVDARVDRGGAEAAAACDALLSTFVGVLLPAHRSKFTQFLLFHACARDAAKEKNAAGTGAGGGDLSSRVVDVLIERLTDPHHPPAGRLASAAYLASFLARAAFLSPAFLAATLRRLAKWCLATARAAASGAGVVGVAGDKGARGQTGTLARGFGSSFKIAGESGGGGESDSGAGDGDGDGGDGDAKKSETTQDGSEEYANASAATLAVFDSACQALMYALCYRMEDVLRLGGEPAAELRRLPLREILYSRLQPLHTCLPSVVGEFLHRAVAAGMEGFDADLLERHKREKKEKEAAEKRDPNAAAAPAPLLRTTSSAALGSEVAEAVRHRRPLRMFFPFDPYLLRRSAALLRLPMTYVTWQGSARQDDDDDDDEDLDLDGEDGEDDDSESDDDDDDSDDESGGRAGSRSGSHGFGPHGSFNSSLPNSLNPRPRKLTRGLLGPQPLFGGKSASPVFGGGLGPGPGSGSGLGPGPGLGLGAASNPIVGFGVGSGIGNIGVGSAGGYVGAVGGGVPSAFGGNSPGGSRGSPSPLGASPLSGGGAFPGSLGSVGGSGSGAKDAARSAAEQTGRARGTPPRYPKRSAG